MLNSCMNEDGSYNVGSCEMMVRLAIVPNAQPGAESEGKRIAVGITDNAAIITNVIEEV